MQIDLEKFTLLKKSVEKSQRERDESAGVIKQLTSQLQKDFDCKDVNEAKEWREELVRKETKLVKEFNIWMIKFEEKCRGQL